MHLSKKLLGLSAGLTADGFPLHSRLQTAQHKQINQKTACKMKTATAKRGIHDCFYMMPDSELEADLIQFVRNSNTGRIQSASPGSLWQTWWRNQRKMKKTIHLIITTCRLLRPVHRPTKALPHPSMCRTCSPTATTVSGCVLSGSARTPRSWAVPTAPQWPCPLRGMTWPWAAARPAPAPGPAQSPTESEGVWQTSSALSSSSWFLPSLPSSLLLLSSTLSLNEQSAPPSCRVIALFPPVPLWFLYSFSLYRVPLAE